MFEVLKVRAEVLKSGFFSLTVRSIGMGFTISMVMRYAHHSESLRAGVETLVRLPAAVAKNTFVIMAADL